MARTKEKKTPKNIVSKRKNKKKNTPIYEIAGNAEMKRNDATEFSGEEKTFSTTVINA